MLNSMPTRSRTATGSHPALALLCLGAALYSSRHPYNRPIKFANAETSWSDMAHFGSPRTRTIVSALPRTYPIPIHPPR